VEEPGWETSRLNAALELQEEAPHLWEHVRVPDRVVGFEHADKVGRVCDGEAQPLAKRFAVRAPAEVLVATPPGRGVSTRVRAGRSDSAYG
jgi:hypothetical protein